MLRLLPTSEQATMLAAQGFGLQAIMNVITKGRGGRALVSAEVAAIERIAKNTKPSIHTVSGTVYNQQAIAQIQKGQLPGRSTGGNIGVPREMASSTNPNAMAQDFINRMINGQKYTMTNKGNSSQPKYLYQLQSGDLILYRPAGSASIKTNSTTATIEINSSKINVENKGVVLKLKFPVKSEIKK